MNASGSAAAIEEHKKLNENLTEVQQEYNNAYVAKQEAEAKINELNAAVETAMSALKRFTQSSKIAAQLKAENLARIAVAQAPQPPPAPPQIDPTREEKAQQEMKNRYYAVRQGEAAAPPPLPEIVNLPPVPDYDAQKVYKKYDVVPFNFKIWVMKDAPGANNYPPPSDDSIENNVWRAIGSFKPKARGGRRKTKRRGKKSRGKKSRR